jgi:hypothetical protein
MLSAAVAAVAFGLGAAAANAAPSTAPSPQPMVDGIRCDMAEGSVFHIHQHLALFDHGKPVLIPNDVGRPLSGDCLFWIHTHSSDGLIHIESPTFRTFTLGEFFDIWGQPLSATRMGPAKVQRGQLHAFVSGLRYSGDVRKIELHAHSVIVLEAGPPYAVPKPFTDWQGQ